MVQKNGHPKRCKLDLILWAVFAVSMAAYVVVFATAFAELPLNIPSWHQGLLLYFHAVPLFSLQMLLCRRAKLCFKILAPLGMLAIPGSVFLHVAQWEAMAWILYLCWCMAPVLGCALAWAIWAIGKGCKKAQGHDKAV